MKRFALLLTVLLIGSLLSAQNSSKSKAAKGKAANYEITINFNKNFGDKLFLAQHFRDDVVMIDSVSIVKGNSYTFKGKKSLERGIYCIARYGTGKEKDKLKSMFDFTIDDSYTFSITADTTFKQELMKVKGSKANELMYAYIAKNNDARAKARDIQNRMKSDDSTVRNQANKEMDELSEVMIAFEKQQMEDNKGYRFFQLLKMFGGPEVPDSIEDKPYYYRMHYWDGIDLTDHSLIYTPDLFNKMNYYFYGVLYYADADTICKYADRVIDQVEMDTTMIRYFLDFIMPKYFRSTRNVGWDQVWCHLVRRYYQPNKSGFALPGDRTYKMSEAARLEKSLIGAAGAELFMTDTLQRDGAQFMISSHRFPQKYVVLWIWDPDCHHCQEQTAKLIPYYDSLTAIGKRNFEVYAIGYESDVKKWKNYVRQHELPFVNVGGPNVNVDYQVEYNVHGAPTMIILNADRQLIMNKTLPANAIQPFIEQYEKEHPEQANREPSIWQKEGERIWGPNGFDPAAWFAKDQDDFVRLKTMLEARLDKYRK